MKQQKFEPVNEVIITFETLEGRLKALDRFSKVVDKNNDLIDDENDL